MTEHNNGNDAPNLGDEITRVIKLGVGAVAGAVEKGVGFVSELTTEGTDTNKRAAALGEQLTRKGEKVLDKTAKFGGQIKDKVVEAVNSIPVGYENVAASLEGLADEQLSALRDKVDELLSKRAADAEKSEPAADEAPEEKDEEQS